MRRIIALSCMVVMALAKFSLLGASPAAGEPQCPQ